MKRPLRFYDIAVGRAFVSTDYEVVEVKSTRLAVAKSPYTGNTCYSFAPRRAELKSERLDRYLAA
ncbi:MAG: hypothetical protein ABWJ97_07460 [Thermoproteus sp.]